jgi:hypothetical protein
LASPSMVSKTSSQNSWCRPRSKKRERRGTLWRFRRRHCRSEEWEGFEHGSFFYLGRIYAGCRRLYRQVKARLTPLRGNRVPRNGYRLRMFAQWRVNSRRSQHSCVRGLRKRRSQITGNLLQRRIWAQNNIISLDGYTLVNTGWQGDGIRLRTTSGCFQTSRCRNSLTGVPSPDRFGFEFRATSKRADPTRPR